MIRIVKYAGKEYRDWLLRHQFSLRCVAQPKKKNQMGFITGAVSEKILNPAPQAGDTYYYS